MKGVQPGLPMVGQGELVDSLRAEWPLVWGAVVDTWCRLVFQLPLQPPEQPRLHAHAALRQHLPHSKCSLLPHPAPP